MAALHGLNEQLVALQFLPQVVADEVQPLVLGDRCEPTAPVSNPSSSQPRFQIGSYFRFKREKPARVNHSGVVLRLYSTEVLGLYR